MEVCSSMYIALLEIHYSTLSTESIFFRAPTDCMQYLTGVSNSFKSFNFGNLMIRNLQYDVCIRPEKGYCRFQLMESSSNTDSFKIDPASTTTTSKVRLKNISYNLTYKTRNKFIQKNILGWSLKL